jgi:hypothetical protein
MTCGEMFLRGKCQYIVFEEDEVDEAWKGWGSEGFGELRTKAAGGAWAGKTLVNFTSHVTHHTSHITRHTSHVTFKLRSSWGVSAALMML